MMNKSIIMLNTTINLTFLTSDQRQEIYRLAGITLFNHETFGSAIDRSKHVHNTFQIELEFISVGF